MKTIEFEGKKYEVEDWVNWVARDSHDSIIGFENEPDVHGYSFLANDVCHYKKQVEKLEEELETLRASNTIKQANIELLQAELDEERKDKTYFKNQFEDLKNSWHSAMVEIGKLCGEDFSDDEKFRFGKFAFAKQAVSKVVNERDSLKTENAKLIAEHDDLLSERIAYASVCDSLLAREDEVRKLIAEREAMMKQEPVFYATKNLNIVITAETYNCGTDIGQADYPVPLYTHPLPAQQIPEITLPEKKPVPGPDIPIQAWDGDDFENSAYNNAIDDMAEILINQGFAIRKSQPKGDV